MRFNSHRLHLLPLAFAIIIWTTLTAAAAPPLRVSDNGRFLQYQDGTPFFMVAGTSWDLFHRLNRAEVDLYLENRAQRRFNTILAVVPSATLSFGATNVYGHAPFLGNNPATPNPAFFAHVDYCVERAAALGMFVGLLPVWGRDVVDTGVVNVGNAEAYGMFLGARYATRPIIWVLGGDRIGTNKMDVWRALARGIARGVNGGVEDQTQVLMTYHSATDSAGYHLEAWLDFNSLQSGHGQAYAPSFQMVQNLYNLTPTKPVIDLEPNYEDHPINWLVENGRFDDLSVRRQGYWGVLSGAAGATYGATGVFQFFKPGDFVTYGARYYWDDAILLPGAMDMMHLRGLMESRPYFTRRPDQTILTSAPLTGADHQRASSDTLGTYLVVYFPTGQPATVNMSKITGMNVNAWWFNPREGGANLIAQYSNIGNRVFVPPTTNDWVLVLDDAAQGYLAPGMVPAVGPLQIVRNGNEVVLRWTETFAPLRLETTSEFSSALLAPTWSASTLGPTNRNGINREIRFIPGDPMGFFRLRYP